MKTLLSFTIGGVAALSSAQTISLASPSNWQFNYDGSYQFAAASSANNSAITSLLGSTVGLQLGLLQGGMTSSQSATLAQAGTAVSTSNLQFTANPPSGLLNGLGGFLVNALNSESGPYSGILGGTALALSGPSLATVVGQIDTRVGGTGSVFDLTASLVGTSLNGTVDGVHFGVGDHVTGIAGSSGTLNIGLGQKLYVGGFLTSTTPVTQVGAITTTANSWSLSRAQAVPEPGSLAAVGFGIAAMARRRRKAV